jgi:glucose/arabinose dehydrogenase
MRIVLVAGFLFTLLALAPRAAAVTLEPVGTFDEPIFVTAPSGDPRLFVVERAGRIQVHHDGVWTHFLDIHTLTTTDGERGLLSMAFDPNYAANGLFYVFFTDSGSGGAPLGDIHIDEFHVSADPNIADPASRRPVATVTRGTTASNHNGGQLQFGKDGFLYASVGDAANSSNAQNPANLNGKILRIDPHAGGAPQVWSLGLRNPFRFSFDHLTGDMVIGDVGASSVEEIDFAPAAAGLGAGANFGWPACEGFSGTCPGTTAPVFAYANSDPCNAVIGGYVYRGSRAPELSGRYLYTDLCHPELRSLSLATPLATGDRSEGVTLPSSPYSFGEDANCDLYIAASSGAVQRIVGSAASAAPACPSSPATSTPSPATSTPVRKKKCKKRRLKIGPVRIAPASHAVEAKKKRCKKRGKKR